MPRGIHIFFLQKTVVLIDKYCY